MIMSFSLNFIFIFDFKLFVNMLICIHIFLYIIFIYAPYLFLLSCGFVSSLYCIYCKGVKSSRNGVKLSLLEELPATLPFLLVICF